MIQRCRVLLEWLVGYCSCTFGQEINEICCNKMHVSSLILWSSI